MDHELVVEVDNVAFHFLGLRYHRVRLVNLRPALLIDFLGRVCQQLKLRLVTLKLILTQQSLHDLL